MPPPRSRGQRLLFEDLPAAPAVRFPPEVQEQLRQALVQWMQALAQKIQQEDRNEQDHR